MKLFECIGVLTSGKTIARQHKNALYKVSILDFCCLCEYEVEGMLISRPWVVEKSDLEAEDWEILS
jgi:hypothetical protein